MDFLHPSHLLASSHPGGIARQFRVQFYCVEAVAWQLYATYPSCEQAQRCVEMLERNGYAARLVDYKICASAA